MLTWHTLEEIKGPNHHSRFIDRKRQFCDPARSRKHNERHPWTLSYCSLLHLAATKNYAKFCIFITSDIDWNSRQNDWTPLHVATYFKNIEVVLVLFGHKADTNALTNSFEKATDLSDHELILSVLNTRTHHHNHMNIFSHCNSVCVCCTMWFEEWYFIIRLLLL